MLLPVDNPVFVKLASQARNVWERFLLHRAKELVTGVTPLLLTLIDLNPSLDK